MSRPTRSSRLAHIRAAIERHSEELTLMQAVAEAANESTALDSVLAEAVEMICEHMNWQLGHALAVERRPGAAPGLRSLGIWYLEDEQEFAPLRAASSAPASPAVLEALLIEHAPVLLTVRSASDSRFTRRELSSMVGLEHYYALPIMSGDEIVAALEFMTNAPSSHDPEHLRLLLSSIGTTLGRVAERETRARERTILLRSELAREQAEDRADQLQRLTAELRQRNRELDQFAYVASHDLRAPLRGIANLATWIAEDLEPHLTADTRRYLELLQDRIKRLESLINGLLEYSRVGRRAVSDQDIDLGEFVREIAEMHDPEAAIEWVVHELPTIRGSRLLLNQVLGNLVSNAVKYATVERPRIEIRATAPRAGLLRVSVSDNGPGIAPRYHERIWKIFQALQPHDSVESTGIGLSLVRKIVKQRGGEVGIESQPGAGATFWFTWPEHPDRAPEDTQ